MLDQRGLDFAQLAQFGVEGAQRYGRLLAQGGFALIERGDLQAERLLPLDAIEVGRALERGYGLETIAQGLAELGNQVAALMKPGFRRRRVPGEWRTENGAW